MKKRIYIVLAVFTAMIPLGLLSDAPAWGEWETTYYKKILGFIPQGIANAKEIKTPLKEYSLSAFNDVVGYYFSAFIGIVIIFAVFYLLARLFRAKRS